MATHRLGPSPATVHWGYLDAKIPPRLTINSGDTVTVDTVSGGFADSATPLSCCRTTAKSVKSLNLRPVRIY